MEAAAGGDPRRDQRRPELADRRGDRARPGRGSREARYRTIFRTPEGKYVDYEPKTLEEFATLGVGTERALRIDDAGEVEVLE